MTTSHLIVGSNVIERDGSFLLVKEGKEEVQGLWNLPAGTMENDENPVKTARREAEEETGLVVEPEGLIGVFVDWSDVSDGRVANFAFHSTVEDPRPSVPENESVEKCEWFEPWEIEELELRAPYILEAIARFEEENIYPLKVVEDLT